MIIEKYLKDLTMREYIAEYTDFDASGRGCAQCSSYNRVWSCPPFDFSRRGILSSFGRITVDMRRILIGEADRSLTYKQLFAPAKDDLFSELRKLERERPGSMALLAGSCDICGPAACSRLKGEACRRPDLMRHSIESMGGDTARMAERLFGMKMLWKGEDGYPPYYLLFGALAWDPQPN